MENMFGIKISRIALPTEKLTESEWFEQTKAGSRYVNKQPIYNAISLNSNYDFSKIKNKNYESTNTGA